MALYNILGLEKKHIMIMMLYETIVTTFVSLVMGFVFGIIFSQLASLLLIHLMGLSSNITFHISWSSFLLTIIVFLPIYLISYLIHVIQIQLSNPVELLRGAQSGEKEPKTKWLLTIIGLLSLGVGYYIALTIDDPMTAVALFLEQLYWLLLEPIVYLLLVQLQF
ncbi:FtsX-like permease family protein [Allocoprobacillus halotolerans]|uniref:FtsX-like permease family protein n=1 Tax=Allocoprobacillus halotolerans TaxID=2944914 RepID=A0ABY5I3I5_9FIRM|nr:FtsX-like permease family protein [Allocoprobacillus halotolerans]UTY39919.1 FtsX-like permease family protein [Allocoprobacillus halotolerans]